ncbi:helix-turn-helix transcriptional regulator [Frankia sp. CNm7]|uniref:Helix-turn-helix transcriptional regulator n=1 Tax=Frankia nepalensis TaxID=1836974 RepID=A0A937RD24_9ACTN|nr:helix-turn-helix domain-containing protein [Frankia nepalensis]MBL7500307.1 helix-turn-helix transcriptional regulator [Frankia nepalensis]MBL7508529.1 helix-turn-helix transcriptional regulator [Frankia nepalensis]MBL7520430.1 helix-turn-helix transcriptional regulator [Frankia nepalensis]MBL7627657.1 helix-turn-helix transcriptional regulator [Frankia nepalensis]
MDVTTADGPAARFDAFAASCPSRRLLDTIGDKWASLVIVALGLGGRMRYSELSARIAGVSQKMLTQTLRGLERDGLLTRAVTPSVPVRVDYELTPLGQSLLETICRLKEWAEVHMPEVDAARAAYDRNHA